MTKNLKIVIAFIIFSLQIYAQEENKDFYVTKGKGYEFHFFDDAYLLQLDFRGQFRASFPYNGFPVDVSDFDEERANFGINRARIKIGGYVNKPYFTYYFEQDIRNFNLLDFRAQFEKYDYFKVRIGQWKARYSRERIISSGKQTGLERSLINRPFTIDRQQGLSFYGNLDGGGAANMSYWVSAFTGMGRGGTTNDDNSLMYMTRLQWNPNGKDLGFSGSDLKYHDKFISSLAIAGVTNTSRYTRFSTSGGGQLYGYEPGVDGQYKIDQFLIESAFKYRGLSWQQEFHYKNIDDKINFEETTLLGNYIQLGYFFHHIIPGVPKQFEVFARHSYYDPNNDIKDNNNYEYTVGLNWFFKGHRNKLTFDYSYLDYNEFISSHETGNRFRLQWDVSIF